MTPEKIARMADLLSRTESLNEEERQEQLALHEEHIARINELAKKAKTSVGLTVEEAAERKALRAHYIASFRHNLQSQLDNMYVLDENGNEKKIEKRTDRIH